MESSSPRARSSQIWRELGLLPTRKHQRGGPNPGRHRSVPRRMLCVRSLGCLPPLAVEQVEGYRFLVSHVPERGGCEGWGGSGGRKRNGNTFAGIQKRPDRPTEAASAKQPRAPGGSSITFLFPSVSGMWWGPKKKRHLVCSSQKYWNYKLLELRGNLNILY